MKNVHYVYKKERKTKNKTVIFKKDHFRKIEIKLIFLKRNDRFKKRLTTIIMTIKYKPGQRWALQLVRSLKKTLCQRPLTRTLR